MTTKMLDAGCGQSHTVEKLKNIFDSGYSKVFPLTFQVPKLGWSDLKLKFDKEYMI